MLEVKNIYKSYKNSFFFSNKCQNILKDISFNMEDNICLGILGESGSGKSTLGRLILGIEKPDSGQILFDGKDVQKREWRKGKMSAVFQDYTSSTNPNWTVEETIKEPLELLKIDYDRKYICKLLEEVGLNEKYLSRYPHELSGGETQRVCIARTIATKPKFILLDEAISSLDVSVQVQILDLLKKIYKSNKMSFLFITHDIQAATYICDEIIILKNGGIVERLEVENINKAKHPYFRQLLNAVFTI
ncbi:MAG: ABC transporter ATP-binding protein [Treponemataceae bacterium]